MIAVIQRVQQSSVVIDEKQVAKINNGLNVLLCVVEEDTKEDIYYMADKIAKLRIFSDDFGKMNLSVQDINGEMLVISQFTLAADTKKGNRPSFIASAKPDKAEEYYELFKEYISKNYNIPLSSGVFSADMQVSIVNDGPVTIILDSKKNKDF